MSTKAIAEKLDLNLVEPEGWKCCGTSPAHNTNHYRSIRLPMETLAIADDLGHSYMTMPCAACFSRFRVAMHEVQQDQELRQKIADDIGFEYTGGIEVDSLLTTITERVGYRGCRQTGRQTPGGAQGSLLLWLPAHPPAWRNRRRQLRIPNEHGPARRGVGCRGHRLVVQDRLLWRFAVH